jgi:hypothetical protein
METETTRQAWDGADCPGREKNLGYTVVLMAMPGPGRYFLLHVLFTQ